LALDKERCSWDPFQVKLFNRGEGHHRQQIVDQWIGRFIVVVEKQGVGIGQFVALQDPDTSGRR